MISALIIFALDVTAQDNEVIGFARMRDDGTIAYYPYNENVMADGQAIIKPDDDNYQKILEHIGGLKIGEGKPVPPWPKENEIHNKSLKSGTPQGGAP